MRRIVLDESRVAEHVPHLFKRHVLFDHFPVGVCRDSNGIGFDLSSKPFNNGLRIFGG